MQNLTEEILKATKEALDDISNCSDIQSLRKISSVYKGKESNLYKILTEISKLQGDEKKFIGSCINESKEKIDNALSQKEQILKIAEYEKEESEYLDITLNKEEKKLGSTHPVTQMIQKIVDVFSLYGFSHVTDREIETDWFCFQALNMGIDHPAREMQDTFYIEENHILPRTHTSSVQIRTMLKAKPPIRIISTGRVYRNENQDARHSFMFYQYEGLIIDNNISIADLKSILTQALRRIFENDKIDLRLRHSYFPYTEPSFEVDATCMLCQGKGCKVCDFKGWLELLGAGMVHPQVLRNVKIDPKKYQGFAFGGGPERLIMIKNEINDTRLFYENDLRFLSQLRKL